MSLAVLLFLCSRTVWLPEWHDNTSTFPASNNRKKFNVRKVQLDSTHTTNYAMNYIVAILKVVPQYALTSNIVKCVKCHDPLLEIRSLS